MFDQYAEGPNGSTIIVRPKYTLDIERRLVPGAFVFRHEERAPDGWEWEDVLAYDRRYVDQHRVPAEQIWIVGWWESYFGLIPEMQPLNLLRGHPFHHPWFMTGVMGEVTWYAQRKPIPWTWHQYAYYKQPPNCWYAVEIGAAQPSITADVDAMLAALPVGKMATQDSSQVPDPRIVYHQELYAQLGPVAQALLGLPITVLGGLAKARQPKKIRAWAWECVRWMNEQDPVYPTWVHGVCAYKHHQIAELAAAEEAEEEDNDSTEGDESP